mmetsp:Transcript_8987/g.23872  ORF Transcript_8987/g.23872 Transcript_8987/m.23872 type:complete len:82 (+) Transcript_8987:125-370(+)
MCCNFACSCLCAYIFPPLGIYWRFGCGTELVICVVLTILGYVPGIIYAAFMIGCESGSRARELKPLREPIIAGVPVVNVQD